MVKQTQTIRRQKATICLSVLDHHVGLALKVLEKKKKKRDRKKETYEYSQTEKWKHYGTFLDEQNC